MGDELTGDELTVDLVSPRSHCDMGADCSRRRSLWTSSVAWSTYLPGGDSQALEEQTVF